MNQLPDDIPLETLDLSVRTFNALHNNAGLRTLGQVRKLGDRELLLIPNFGRKSLKEIRDLCNIPRNPARTYEDPRKAEITELRMELALARQRNRLLPSDRNLLILADRLLGKTYAKITEEYGISIFRVKQVCHRFAFRCQSHVRSKQPGSDRSYKKPNRG